MPFKPTTTCDITIDVSHWQGTHIDWNKVKAAGKRVVMVKATQGAQIIDDAWKVNAAGARAAGLFVIPYSFLTPDDATAQAKLFEHVAELQSNMPAAIDWEGKPHSTASAQQLEQIGQAVESVIKRAPLGYWGLFPPAAPTPATKHWPRWIPRYGIDNGQPDFHHEPDVPWLFWQYTSKATVPGVTGHVDASLFSGSEAELAAWCQSGALPASLAQGAVG
jgi:lysozyme